MKSYKIIAPALVVSALLGAGYSNPSLGALGIPFAVAEASADARQYKETDVAASLNGQKYTIEEVDKLIESNPRFSAYKKMAGDQTALINRVRRTAVESLIDRNLLLSAADKAGVKSDKTIDERFEQIVKGYGGIEKMKPLLEQIGTTLGQFEKSVRNDLIIERYISTKVGSQAKVSEAEMKQEFEDNKKSYAQPEQVRARHILFKVDEKAGEKADKEALLKLNNLKKEITAKNFEEYAKKHSQGPSASRGGDLGYFARGQMVKPFETAAFAMKAGQISEPIKTKFGYHLLLVENKKPAVEPKFEMAKSRIEAKLLDTKRRDLVKKHVASLRKDARISVTITESPL